jgi:hypothetical protein
MIELYGSRHEKHDWLWCPILGEWFLRKQMTAAHLFAYMHGQETMDSIFGKTKTPELFSPKNGLIISSLIEDVFDSGKLVIVPDVPNIPSASDISAWVRREPRKYKVQIIDPTWDQLGERIITTTMLWKELHNKRLEFRTTFRPHARYLYFHYCVQVLRHVWQHNGEGALTTLNGEMGKPVWGTPGRYMSRKMLKALIEELGHKHDNLLQGSSCNGKGNPHLLLHTVAGQVAASGPTGDADDEEENDDEYTKGGSVTVSLLSY